MTTAFDDLLYPPEHRADDAVSGIVAQTLPALAARAGVTRAFMRGVLKTLIDRGMAVEHNKLYKLDTGGPWLEAIGPLPLVNVPHRISLDSSSDGYTVEVFDHEPVDPTEPVAYKPPELGQSELI